MKIYRFFEKVVVLVLLCLCSFTVVSAQANASGASVSRSRAIVNSGPYTPAPAPNGVIRRLILLRRLILVRRIPVTDTPAPVFRIPEEVAVEEFVNYHKHRLPLPKVGQAVAMDTRFGNAEIAPIAARSRVANRVYDQ